MSELQDALKRYDEWIDPPDEADVSTFVLAARLVADPNIEAIADELKLHLDGSISEDVDWLWIAETAVAAALTRPGEPTEDE